MATDRAASEQESEIVDFLQEVIESVSNGHARAVIVAVDDGTHGDYMHYWSEHSQYPRMVCLSTLCHNDIVRAACPHDEIEAVS